jgi:hypothetical protein
MLPKIPRIDTAAIARHPKTRLWGRRLAIFFAVVGVLGFLVAPPLIKSVLLSKLGEALHREVSIDSISFNPYTLTLRVNGVSVRERSEGKPGDEVFGFEALTVNAELTSMAVAGIVVKEVELVGPRANIVRLDEKRYNISDLIEPSGEEKPESAKGGLPRFSVSNIQIRGGNVTFDDRPEGVKHEVTDIAMRVPFLSTLSFYADTYVEPYFSATINGAPLVLQGKSRPFADSHESELALDLDNVQLARYLAYSPVDLPIRVLSGALDGDLRLRFVQSKDLPATLSISGKLGLKDLKVEQTGGAPLLAMKRLDVGLRDVDPIKRSIGIASVELTAPSVDVRIGKDGVANWLSLLPPATEGKAPEKPADKASEGPPVVLLVDSIAIREGVVDLLDQSTGSEQKGSIRDISLEAHNFDSSGARPVTFSLGWQVDAGERLKVEQIAIRDGSVDLKKREIVIGEYLVKGTRARMTRQADGKLAWFKAPTLRLAQAARKDKDEPWQLTVARADLEGQRFELEDLGVSPKATQTVELQSLHLENLSTRPDAEARLAAKLRINSKGELEVDGTLKPMLPQGSLRVDARSIELLPLQPYFGQFLNLTVTRGIVSAKGEVGVAPAKTGLAVGYKGDLTLGDFHSVDKINSSNFLRWKSFHFGQIDVTSNPPAVAIGEIALSDFFARVIVSPEGKLNLLQMVRGKESAEAPAASGDKATEKPAEAPAVVAMSDGEGRAEATLPPKPASDPVPVRIGKVTLQGGRIAFSDNFIKPNYSANLTKVAGRVTGLSSVAGTMAELELRGSYNDLAPLTVTAKLNPFAAKRYLDLDAEVKGIEMTGFSPYSGKYAGYAIEKGKLSLFLKYRIDDNKLVAENRIFLDQLTFGEPVDSPDATKLPVTLAVSLLKNRAGEIDINLPISGSLDDPEFSVGGVVVKVIVNLFVKAVTSPFALLGSLFGGGEEMAYVEFDYGYATITAPMRERLQSLAKALEDRPALKIELAGRIDPDSDREGLKHAMMMRRVKAQRLDELVKQGTESGSVEDVQISEKDYPRYLEKAYKAEKFPKPRNMIGLLKDLPVEEMEKLMMANMKADDEALRRLADRRAREVAQWLGEEGKVASERIFILQPNLTPAEGPQQEKAKGSRVDFSLK